MGSGKGKMKQHWKVAISKKKKKVKREGHPHLPRSFCTMVGLAWLFTDGAVERSFLGEPGEHLLHLWVAAGAGPAITSHSARV